MKTVKIFEIDEEVMIKVQVADVIFKKGEMRYQLKDPTTAKCFDYLFDEDQIIPCEAKPVSKPKEKQNE